MFGIVHPLLGAIKHVCKIHDAAVRKPRAHTRLVVGHGLELTAVAAQALEFRMLCDVAGVIGAAILVYHVLTTPGE